MEIRGKYNTAKVFTDNVNSETISQIMAMCNIPSLANDQIRIMPDCHKAKGCVVGTTIAFTESIIPTMVGTDIGCGMGVTVFKKTDGLDFQKLENFLREDITPIKDKYRGDPKLLKGLTKKVDNNVLKTLGTLGGGNHFIELNEDEENIYLVIHTGSRWLGVEVANYHAEVAIANSTYFNDFNIKGQDLENYLNDLKITQEFATLNRKIIAEKIIDVLNIGHLVKESWESPHNYVDIGNKILHKGSCSAMLGEKVIVPISMLSGSIIATGKGNTDWNISAPHGAGRLLTRGQSKEILSLEDFEKDMEGIWTTSVKHSMLSESSKAYKPLDEILEMTKDTLDNVSVIKPIYNLKNS